MYRWTHHRFVDGRGVDRRSIIPINMWWIARAAAEETLQGGPLVPAWLKLFRAQLSVRDGYWFRWRGDLAESAELRRAYSGLYGRFVARALLTEHLNFSRFVSLQRNGIEVAGSIRVCRNKSGDIPDWLAWDDNNSQFALCEAKGSLTANDFHSTGQPGCVRTGKAQFDRVSCIANGRQVNPAQWVAASRWATETRNGQPTTLLWDPPAGESSFSDEEVASHRTAISKVWLDSISRGLGWRDGSDLLLSDREKESFQIVAEPGGTDPNLEWPVSAIDDDDFAETQSVVQGERDFEFVENNVVASRTEDAIAKLEPRGHENLKHEGRYLIALITRFGVRPIRTIGEFETFKLEQERAQKLEEPAMIVGLPLDFDPSRRRNGELWLDESGLAPQNDLAVFDARFAQVKQF